MSGTIIWDESGTRYYETGVSKGLLFDMNFQGVAWNGLVAVSIDPQGGESDVAYFDGLKFMNKTLAEDFQATIQAISTPREFESCEGVLPLKHSFGGKTHFNKRAKFNLVWRTEIGNDLEQAIAYKLHIAYNCLVQPSGHAYQTISDNTTPDIRSFVITTSPACGRHSYFTFDSRDGDLSLLEAQLYSGVLPKCYELAALTGTDGGDNPPPAEDDCRKMFETFDGYNPGQLVNLDITPTALSPQDKVIYGLINNGLDVTELPAVGAFAANDSAASVVGTGVILADDNDATYITSADGDLGYTIGLPPLVGYVDGSVLELHIRVSITGDVNPADPDNIDADMQVHISTDNTGDITIGGFSDGTDEGMGFALSSVDGTIVDYVIPLDLDAWVDSTIEEVVTALQAGAYLNVVGASNNNFNTTPVVRVYNAKIVVLDYTDPDKWLRAATTANSCGVEMTMYVPLTTTVLTASVTDQIDFKVMSIPFQSSHVSGFEPLALPNAGGMTVDMVAGVPTIRAWNSTYSAALATQAVTLNVWYRCVIDWSWDSVTIRVFAVDAPDSILINVTYASPSNPKAAFTSQGGAPMGDSTKSYEIALDNAKIQVHCHDIHVVVPGSVTLVQQWLSGLGSQPFTTHTLPAGTQAGDLLIAMAGLSVFTNSCVVTPSTLTRQTFGTPPGNPRAVFAWGEVVDPSEPVTFQHNPNSPDSGSNHLVAAFHIDGVRSTSVIQQTLGTSAFQPTIPPDTKAGVIALFSGAYTDSTGVWTALPTDFNGMALWYANNPSGITAPNFGVHNGDNVAGMMFTFTDG